MLISTKADNCVWLTLCLFLVMVSLDERLRELLVMPSPWSASACMGPNYTWELQRLAHAAVRVINLIMHPQRDLITKELICFDVICTLNLFPLSIIRGSGWEKDTIYGYTHTPHTTHHTHTPHTHTHAHTHTRGWAIAITEAVRRGWVWGCGENKRIASCVYTDSCSSSGGWVRQSWSLAKGRVGGWPMSGCPQAHITLDLKG